MVCPSQESQTFGAFVQGGKNPLPFLFLSILPSPPLSFPTPTDSISGRLTDQQRPSHCGLDRDLL